MEFLPDQRSHCVGRPRPKVGWRPFGPGRRPHRSQRVAVPHAGTLAPPPRFTSAADWPSPSGQLLPMIGPLSRLVGRAPPGMEATSLARSARVKKSLLFAACVAGFLASAAEAQQQPAHTDVVLVDLSLIFQKYAGF